MLSEFVCGALFGANVIFCIYYCGVASPWRALFSGAAACSLLAVWLAS